MIRTTLSPVNELAALGWAALTGLAVGIYYDLLRIIRRVFRCNYATVMSQDLFFWLTSAVCVFFAAIITGDGIVRVNFVVVVLVAALVYCLTIGSVVVSVLSTVFLFVKKTVFGVINALYVRVIVPVYGKLSEFLKNMKKSQKKCE